MHRCIAIQHCRDVRIAKNIKHSIHRDAIHKKTYDASIQSVNIVHCDTNNKKQTKNF